LKLEPAEAQQVKRKLEELRKTVEILGGRNIIGLDIISFLSAFFPSVMQISSHF